MKKTLYMITASMLFGCAASEVNTHGINIVSAIPSDCQNLGLVTGNTLKGMSVAGLLNNAQSNALEIANNKFSDTAQLVDTSTQGQTATATFLIANCKK